MEIMAWLVVNVYCALLMCILIPIVVKKRVGDTIQGKRYLYLLVVLMITFLVDGLGRINPHDYATYILCRIGKYSTYIIDPILYYCAMRYLAGWVDIDPKRKKPWFYYIKIYMLVNIAMLTASELFDLRIFYYFDENYVYHRAGWPYTLRAAGLFLACIIVEIFVIKYIKNIYEGYRVQLIIFPLLPLLGGLLQTFVYGFAFEYVGMSLSALALFIYVQYKDQTELVSQSLRQEKDIIQLKTVANTDDLTGLYNRRYIQDYFNDVLKEHGNRGILLMIDIDNFKQVNDYLGHDVGDAILVATAEVLKEICRDQDTAARIGGDEFVLYLANATVGEWTGQKCEEIMAKVKVRFAQIMKKDLPMPVSVSIGGAVYPKDGADFDSIYTSADKAMYRVKMAGKAGYEMYDSSNGDNDERGEDKLSDMVTKNMLIMDERGRTTGAFNVSKDEFTLLYQYMKRYTDRYSHNLQLLAFELDTVNGAKCLDEDVISGFVEFVEETTRRGDVTAKFQDGVVFMLMPGLDEKNARGAAARIVNEWKKQNSEYDLIYEIRQV